MATRHRILAAFLTYWLNEIVKRNLAPLTYVSYEGCVRLYIAPHLGSKRIDKLTVRDVREWINKLTGTCQCCAQGKDAKRRPEQQRCCAIGECCEAFPSRRVVQAARDALRAALTHAVTEEEIGKNVASLVKVPKPRRRNQALVGRRSGAVPRRLCCPRRPPLRGLDARALPRSASW